MKPLRADQLLVQRGLAASRSQAQRLIAAGGRWRAAGAQGAWRVLGKGDVLPPDATIELADAAERRYVSRGGLKLEGALRAAGLDVAGWRCLDVGQSTGGFTDCLLAHGAAQVTGVDVGHSQLHPRLRADARVRALERVNARALTAAHFRSGQPIATDSIATNPENTCCRTGFEPAVWAPGGQAFQPPFDLVTGDLSFISLTLVLPALVPLLAAQGHVLMLVKPQFELQPAQVGKGGIVRDAALYAQVQQRIRAACAALGLTVAHWLDSPIAGGDGNREFFVHACGVGTGVGVGARAGLA